MKFLEGGAFCHAGVAQGKLTLTSRWRDANGDPVIGTVDKTFTRAAPTPPPPPPLYHKISPTNARDVRRPSSPARSSSLLRSRRQVHAQPGPGRHPASRGAPLVLGGAPGAPIAASLSCFAPLALAIAAAGGPDPPPQQQSSAAGGVRPPPSSRDELRSAGGVPSRVRPLWGLEGVWGLESQSCFICKVLSAGLGHVCEQSGAWPLGP